MFSLKNLFGDPSGKLLKDTKGLVEAINALEDHYARLTNEELYQLTHKFRNRLCSGRDARRVAARCFCRGARGGPPHH